MDHNARAASMYVEARTRLISPNLDRKKYKNVSDSIIKAIDKSLAYYNYDIINTLGDKQRLAEDDAVKALIKRWKEMQTDGTIEELKRIGFIY